MDFKLKIRKYRRRKSDAIKITRTDLTKKANHYICTHFNKTSKIHKS